MKIDIGIHIFIRHGFTEATKPTFVAKAVHGPVLLSSSLELEESASGSI